MPAWKGWHSLNRNENGNNKGYGYTSKLYVVTWACGWIKESQWRGRFSEVTLQAIPSVKDFHLLMGDSYEEIHSAPPKEDYTVIIWSLVSEREGMQNTSSSSTGLVSYCNLQVTGCSYLFVVPVICSVREWLFFQSLLSGGKIRMFWSKNMLYTVLQETRDSCTAFSPLFWSFII